MNPALIVHAEGEYQNSCFDCSIWSAGGSSTANLLQALEEYLPALLGLAEEGDYNVHQISLSLFVYVKLLSWFIMIRASMLQTCRQWDKKQSAGLTRKMWQRWELSSLLYAPMQVLLNVFQSATWLDCRRHPWQILGMRCCPCCIDGHGVLLAG